MNKKLLTRSFKMIYLPNGWRIKPILHPSGDLEVSIRNEQGNINIGGNLADENWEQESFRETYNLVKK
tara:strand:+ start:113 stop:316 length:204 start_codon:yes stop_codon:yes gene_type:complete